MFFLSDRWRVGPVVPTFRRLHRSACIAMGHGFLAVVFCWDMFFSNCKELTRYMSDSTAAHDCS